ncbi:MAG: 6-bladed beta-propeller, partial [Bradyrhizobium sp.]
MRRWLLVLPLLIGSQASFPQASAQQSVPTINFDSVSNPLKLPTNMYFGEVSGVAVNSKGHVFALSRGNTSGPAYAAAATQLLEFDSNGKFIRE